MLLALLGALLIAAAFLATRVATGAGDEGAGAAPDPAPPRAPGLADAPASSSPPGFRKPGESSPRRGPQPGRTGGRGAPASKAARVAESLERGNVVVILFTQDGADDDATRRAVNTLSEQSGEVVTVHDRIGNLADYGPIGAGLGITRAPAVVIVDSDRNARVIEGYVDEGTLRQGVRDARR